MTSKSIRDIALAELERQDVYVETQGDNVLLVDGHINIDALWTALMYAKPKVALVPCPHPYRYNAGKCCGECFNTDDKIVTEARNILTIWNFGPMSDREALARLHSFIGDFIQNDDPAPAPSHKPAVRKGE